MSTTESSADYLKHVMIELQGLNVPLGMKNTYDTSDPNLMTANKYFDLKNPHTLDERYYSNGVDPVPRKKIDLHQKISPNYHQVNRCSLRGDVRQKLHFYFYV